MHNQNKTKLKVIRNYKLCLIYLRAIQFNITTSLTILLIFMVITYITYFSSPSFSKYNSAAYLQRCDNGSKIFVKHNPYILDIPIGET